MFSILTMTKPVSRFERIVSNLVNPSCPLCTAKREVLRHREHLARITIHVVTDWNSLILTEEHPIGSLLCTGNA